MVKTLMNTNASIVFLLLVAGFVSCTSSEAMSQSYGNKIERKVLKIVEKQKLPSLTLTILHQKSLLDFQYTSEELEQQEIYGIGSTTKLLVAVLVQKLIEEGKVSLNDKLTDYVKGLENIEGIENLTIGNVLSHTSGLEDFTKHPVWIQQVMNNNTPKTFAEKIRLVGNKLSQNPLFEYSNTNYLVLEQVVESLTGKTYKKAFNDFYAEHDLSDIQIGRPDKEIQGFFADKLEAVSQVSNWREYYGYAGEVYTTSKGLHRFSKALFIDGTILNPKSMERLKEWVSMHPNIIPIGRKGKILAYGNGLMKLMYDGKEYVGHSGGTLKYQSFLFVNEEEKTSINIITNCSGRYYNNVFFQELVPTIMEEL
ncbi:serine hydrolase domain-containing protein [Flagellimonas sp. S174]|uniref:serine hydrolase domain-containing protein n=1 Tax=Flagellimonas sp. S174 TaxID=3410790 RepID=UPI003BF619D0